MKKAAINGRYPLLTKSDCELARTQADLRMWVDRVCSEFGATSEGKTAFRLAQAPFVNDFKKEIWPLARFADAFYEGRTDLLFKPVIGSQSYDALILDAESEDIREYVQIVLSIDGQQEHLRMRHLEDHGRAPLTGTQLPRTRKKHPIPEIWGEMVSQDDAREQAFAQIRSAVEAKSINRYESGTSLIVAFEDLHIQSDVDRDALHEFARTQLLSLVKYFYKLYLVSETGLIALSLDPAAV